MLFEFAPAVCFCALNVLFLHKTVIIMSRKLTVKQENFCNFYIETGNASEAYRRAYDCADKSGSWLWVNACKLLKSANVALRVKELQQQQQKKCDITKEEILQLCADVIRGNEVTDFIEERNGKKQKRTLSKSWAIERICKMLGYDAPTRQDVNLNKPMTIEEAKKIIDEL